jgi:hypothetical protein
MVHHVAKKQCSLSSKNRRQERREEGYGGNIVEEYRMRTRRRRPSPAPAGSTSSVGFGERRPWKGGENLLWNRTGRGKRLVGFVRNSDGCGKKRDGGERKLDGPKNARHGHKNHWLWLKKSRYHFSCSRTHPEKLHTHVCLQSFKQTVVDSPRPCKDKALKSESWKQHNIYILEML